MCKAHRLLYHSTLDLRVIKKKRRSRRHAAKTEIRNPKPETLRQKRLADAKGSNKKKKQDKRLGVNPNPKPQTGCVWELVTLPYGIRYGHVTDPVQIVDVSVQPTLIDSGHIHRGMIPSTTRGASLRGVPREQKMLKGHLPRVIYHQVY